MRQERRSTGSIGRRSLLNLGVILSAYSCFKIRICFIFRDSKKKIPNTCRMFFDDHRHIEEQFKYLTGTQGLIERVEENFVVQMGKCIIPFLLVAANLEFVAALV